MSNSSISVLKKHWGYTTFRSPQEEIIAAVLDNKDVLAVLPTGAGKSICYQVPAILLKGITLVISPLIALMNDQVEQLNKRNVSAFLLHSGITKGVQENTLGQIQKLDYALLYLSPEKLASEWFQEQLPYLKIKLVAIDEAHCISQWGYDFRSEYLKISKSLKDVKCPKIAVTATATTEVKQDIIDQLGLEDVSKFYTTVYRDNLVYKTIETDDKEGALLRALETVKGCTIIYVRTRKLCQELSHLCAQSGVPNVTYHAGLTREQRNLSQHSWMTEKVSLIIATNAFGMGIDKSNVRNVLHFGAPNALEAYYQEAGRAGRDGETSYAILISSPNDQLIAIRQIETSYQPEQNINAVFQSVCNKLQLAEGYMLEGYRLLDLQSVCSSTALDLIDVHYSLKMLDLSGIIQYQQDFYTPSRLEILMNPQKLFDLYETNETLEQVMKAVIRIYGADIYEKGMQVNPESIARMSKVSKQRLDKVFDYLHERRVIRFFKGTDAPVVKFLIPRPGTNSLPLDRKLLSFLKERANIQLKEMYNYVSSTDCKQKLFGEYFGQKQLTACGKCSSCQEYDFQMSDHVLDLFDHQETIDLDEIKAKLPALNYRELSQSLVYLIDSRKIKRLKEDVFVLIK